MPSSNPIDVEPLQGGLARSRALRQWSAWRAKRAEEVRHESRQLRVHAQALLERSQQLRQRYLLVVCAWCTKRLRWQYLPDAVAREATSHSICRSCCAHVLRELAAHAVPRPAGAMPDAAAVLLPDGMCVVSPAARVMF
jgi:hypothetical protein